ncbi:MAG: twin-arginine translocase TatA/TatE family subunit [Desulfobacteraceae bacterium]|jgi:Tat protein translocase TatB subunit
MFGIGMPEMLLLLAVALIVIGPKKLPDLAKSLGRALGEFKRATSDLKDSIETQTGLGEVRDSINEVKEGIKAQVDIVDSIPDPSKAPSQPTSDETSDGPMDQVKSAFDELNAASDESQTDPPDDQDSKSQGTADS